MAKKTGYYLKATAYFLILTGLVMAVFTVLNWIPSLIAPEEFRKYSSVEDARKRLSLRSIYMPVFLPEELNLEWQPSEVFAQTKPFQLVIMHFRFRNAPVIGLAIQQVEQGAQDHIESKIRITEVSQQNRISLKGRDALLVSALCDNDVPCTRISWNEAGNAVIVTGKMPARDLIRVAGSMISER
jgi:hypothetical protein